MEGCPVCLDGQADPWEIIREIRDVLRLQGSGAAALHLNQPATVDHFATEWPLLVISIRAIWNDLTVEELAAVEKNRGALERLLQRKYGYGSSLASQLCTGVLELHERFNGQWEVVRACVPRYWSDIKQADVATMSGTMSELAGLVGRRYGMSVDQARMEVAEFLEQIDYGALVQQQGHDDAGSLSDSTSSQQGVRVAL